MVLANNLAILLAVIILLWAVSVKIRDVSFIDAFWGFGMVLLAWASWFQIEGQGRRAAVLLALTTLWGMRLALHLFTRWRREGEDPRYKRIIGHAMESKGWSWAKTALLLVFLTQAPLLFITSLPTRARCSTAASGDTRATPIISAMPAPGGGYGWWPQKQARRDGRASSVRYS
jgi:steroid 5-alpha reductase family enzyme